MEEEIITFGKIQGVKEYGRKRAGSLQQESMNIDFNEDNFEAYNPSKRPSVWADIRLKRVMLKEHLDRIGGTQESSIMEKRAGREIDVS